MALYTVDDIQLIKENHEQIILQADAKIRSLFPDAKLSNEQNKEINSILLDFIKKKKRVLYGGYALNALIKEKDKKDAIYPDNVNEIPDIDCYSPTPIEDLMELCNLFHSKGFPKVVGREAAHGDTYKLYINGEKADNNYLDLSYVPNNIFVNLPFILINNIQYIHPHFMSIDYYRMLTDPINSYWRLEKAYTRFQLLQKHYPLEVNNDKFKLYNTMHYTPDVLKTVTKISLKYKSFIHIGQNAYNDFCDITKYNKKVTLQTCEYISTNYKDDVKDFIKELIEKHKVTYTEHYPFFQFFGHSTRIYNGSDLVCIIYNHNKMCIPYNTFNDICYGSFMMVLMFSEMNTIYYEINKKPDLLLFYQQLSTNLVNMRKQYFSKNNYTILSDTILKDFVIECTGATLTIDMQKDIKIEELKKKGLPYVWKYNPDTKIKNPSDNKYIFSNSSGNPIRNQNNKKIVLTDSESSSNLDSLDSSSSDESSKSSKKKTDREPKEQKEKKEQKEQKKQNKQKKNSKK